MLTSLQAAGTFAVLREVTHIMRKGVNVRRAAVLAGFTATAVAVALPGHAAASTGNSSQTVTATVVAGTLTVTAPPALVTNLTPGQSNSGIALGALLYTNTLNSGSSWSVTMTTTDWVNGANKLLFTDMSVTPGTTITPGLGANSAPTNAGGGSFSGADTTPGTTASSPQTLATGASTAQGAYTQAGTTMSVLVPGGTPTGVYTGTITYTITG
jgi:hypothetical protein